MRIIEKMTVCPENHTFFKGCHASTLEFTPGGALVCAFFGGEGEGKPDCAIWTAIRDGDGWLPPQRLVAAEGVPHWNPVLFSHGGETLLYFKVGPDVPSWQTWYTRSADGMQWSEPLLIPSEGVLPRGPVKNKPIHLADGRICAPSSVEGGHVWDCFIDLSGDGVNWTLHPVPFDHTPVHGVNSGGWEGMTALWEPNLSVAAKWDGVIQPTLWEYPDGHVRALMRSTRGVVFRSDSPDGGVTWREAYATDIPNNNAGLDAVHIGGGRVALLYNPVGDNWGARTPLTLAISDDNGANWIKALNLETAPGEYSYPAIIYRGGELHCSYTFNRVNIMYARIGE